jgi:predicted dehydrogenase
MHDYKVALIGAGQLGSRHLQGLAKCVTNFSIDVVEPFEASKAVAKQRYDEIPQIGKPKAIRFCSSIEDLSNELDIVIVATSSDVRFDAVKDLLNSKKVKFLVLEKVLFQKESEYQVIGQLLTKAQTTCIVNHPRRMFPFYQTLKNELTDAKQVTLNVNGGGWGLACNGLHFIDCLSFLTDSDDLTINTDLLDNKVYESKRKGFVEFYGCLSGKIDNHAFLLSCAEEYSPFTVTISSDVLHAFIDEVNGFARIARKANGWKWEIVENKIIHFQSELTAPLVDDLLNHQKYTLPDFLHSSTMHVLFIKALLAKIEAISGQTCERCPIT